MTLDELIRNTEISLEVDKQMATSYRDEAKRENRELDSDDRKTIRIMENKILTGKANLKKLNELKAEEDKQEKRLETIRPTGARSAPRTASVSVGHEQRTYHPGVDAERGLSNSPGGSFLLDVGSAFMGDYTAQERLMRHMAEERIERPNVMQERANSGTGNFVGLVVPAYAVQDAAPAVSAARPMADVMEPRTLPPTGMTVNLSRITTPTSAAIQATQNTNVSSQAISDTILTLNVETAAGFVQLSRQAIERGLLTEDITVADLLTRVAVSLEQQMLSEASVGLATTSFMVSQPYVNADQSTAAVPAFLKQLPQAQNTIEAALLTRARPGYAVMHPRRFNNLTAAVSANWPMFSGGVTPVQTSGLMLTDSYGPSVRAVLNNGMKIVVDANVTTIALGTALSGGAQDHVYVISAQESYLYEPPEKAVFVRAEQPSANQLGIMFVAWEYAAWTFSRYQNQSVLINGTGLGAPTFV